MRIKIFFLVPFVLYNFYCAGQTFYDVSFNYGFRTTLSKSTEINSTVKNLESRYFKQLTPSFNLNFKIINKKKPMVFLTKERNHLYIMV
jgi:hypothetical protein